MDQHVAIPVETLPSAVDDPAPRRGGPGRVPWRGVLQTVDGPFPCLVYDLSLNGARLSLNHCPTRDRTVTLMLGALGTFRGSVVAEEGGMLGIRFTDDRQHLAQRITIKL
jgi:hypothetical protein